MRVLVFDTETTGLPKTKIINPDTLKDWPTIVQFSYIIYDTSLNDIVKYKDHVISIPSNILISEESCKIHGITNEICYQKGVMIQDVLTEFFSYLRGVDILIGHNISFDINMLKVELLRIIYGRLALLEQIKMYKQDLYYLSNFKNICCTLQESIEFCNIKALDKNGKSYLKYPKLIELHEKLFNSTPNNLHNSFNDILVTLRCFMKLKHNIDLHENCDKFKIISQNIGLL